MNKHNYLERIKLLKQESEKAKIEVITMGKPIQMVGIVQDISNAKLIEFKKLIDRGAELERMNEALHREDCLKLQRGQVKTVARFLNL